MQEIIKFLAMYGTPETLFNTTNTQPLSAVLTNNTTLPARRDSMFDMSRSRDVWYTIKDGNWNDITIWRTVRGGRKDFPQTSVSNDDVYIRHTVAVNTSSTVNNCFVSGTLSQNSTTTFVVQGNLQVTGTYNIGSTGATLALYGDNNYINNWIATTNSTVQYLRSGDQNILNIPYYSLSVTSSVVKCYKYLTGDTTVANIFTLASSGSSPSTQNTTLECGLYNLSVLGVTNIGTAAVLSKASSGSVLFVGLVSVTAANSGIFFNGNPTVEMRGGFTTAQTLTFTSGTGLWTFSTNNQTITSSGGTNMVFDGHVLVSGAITVINNSGSGGGLRMNMSLDGDNAGSTWQNKGILYFANATYPVAMPTLGSIDFTTFALSVIGYIFNGNYTIPNTAYRGLAIQGTGTKTLSGNTTLTENLAVSVSGTLEASTFDLTVTTVASVGASSTLSKNGAGALIFIGGLSGSSATINFSGNPTVEIRGGYTTGGTVTLTMGTGLWTFSTNNQNITLANTAQTWSANILVSGAITLTLAATSNALTLTGTLDGNNAGSTFDNRATFNYGNATRPMVTGVLQTNAAVNTFNYNRAGAQDVTGGTYRNLTLSVSGAKTLQGNVSVINTYTLSGTATKNDNGFLFGNP